MLTGSFFTTLFVKCSLYMLHSMDEASSYGIVVQLKARAKGEIDA